MNYETAPENIYLSYKNSHKIKLGGQYTEQFVSKAADLKC